MLARQLRASPYVSDDVICRQGEPADSLYVLAQGHVHVVGDSPDGTVRHKFATLAAPAYFGEMGLLLGAPLIVASGLFIAWREHRLHIERMKDITA